MMLVHFKWIIPVLAHISANKRVITVLGFNGG